MRQDLLLKICEAISGIGFILREGAVAAKSVVLRHDAVGIRPQLIDGRYAALIVEMLEAMFRSR